MILFSCICVYVRLCEINVEIEKISDAVVMIIYSKYVQIVDEVMFDIHFIVVASGKCSYGAIAQKTI